MQVTIKVNQKSFITDPSTWIGQSDFFEALFSGKWGDKQDDGSYFIDADGELFDHILRYLRRGVLPVFYDAVKGHDYALYGALLEEARYFGIPRLERWLSESKYLEAVKTEYSFTEIDASKAMPSTICGGAESSCHPITRRSTKWYCPKGIVGHLRSTCTVYNCSSTPKRDINGGYREEDEVAWVLLQKKTVFNHDLCIEGR